MNPEPEGPYTQEPQLMRFRSRLSRAMESADLTPTDLAREVGRSRQVVWQWLSGVRIPHAVTIVRLSRVLDVPADWLLGTPATECAERVMSLARRLNAGGDGN